jgi:hypothetical protein
LLESASGVLAGGALAPRAAAIVRPG